MVGVITAYKLAVLEILRNLFVLGWGLIHGTERNGTELQSKTRNSRGTLQLDRDGQKLVQ